MRELKLPCEEAIWKVLPVIRKEIAKVLVDEYGISQKEAAELLGVSEAAISQYLKEKRGRSFNLSAEEKYRMKNIAKSLLTEKNFEKTRFKICALCSAIHKKLR